MLRFEHGSSCACRAADSANRDRKGRQRQIVTRAKFPEGTKLRLEEQLPDEELDVQLDAEDIAAIDRALESIRQGKGIPVEVVRARMRRW